MTDERIGTDIGRAVEILRSGGVVGLPTETVYGLGADASNPRAVARVFDIKGRPVDHPLIVHVADADRARAWSKVWPSPAEELARAFWPGPLTLVVERAPHVLDAVTGGRHTVALRCPSHPMMHELLELFQGGVAAPSANRFGKVSPTTARHVLDDLGSDVDYVLDGGSCEVGVESTIVDCTTTPVQVLRPGGISTEQIADVLGCVAPVTGPSRAPGMLESHYAPHCRVHAVSSLTEAEQEVLRLGEISGDCDAQTRVILDASIDPIAFAATMYATLRDCDRRGVTDVFVVLPSESGIGHAIRDRILKASSPR